MAALAWAQFRSYDLLDGAYYFLLYEHPAENFDTHTRFHLLARPIWLMCAENIVAFRIVTLALASLVSWIFWRALLRLTSGTASSASYWWPIWMAALAGLTWVPVALTYNSFATLFILVGLAALIFASERRGLAPKGRWTNLNFALVLGLALIALCLTKPPAAGSFAACSFILLCSAPGLTAFRRRLLIWPACIAVITVAGAAAILVTRADYSPGKLINVLGVELSPAWLQGTLRRYAGEMQALAPSLGRDLKWTVLPTIFACCAAATGRSEKSGARIFLNAAIALLAAAILGALIQRRLWDGSFSAAITGEAARFYLLLWFSLVPLLLACRLRATPSASRSPKARVAWIIVLFALPLMSSFGSTNTPYVSALHETVLWAAGLMLVADQIATVLSIPWFRPIVAAILSTGAAGHIFSGHFLRPYMYQPSLWKQTASVSIGSPATILEVDPDLARFLVDIRSKLGAEGFKPGDDILGFFNLPGVIFAMGGQEPGAPWYFGTWYHHDDTDGGKIRRVPLKRIQNAWIITQADVHEFRPQFLECGIDFPDGYRMIGQTVNPTTGLEIGIWKPLARR